MKFFYLLFLPFLLFGLEDFGKQGYTYEIKEKNFLKAVEDELKHFDTSDIKITLENEVKKQATGENNLKTCKNTREIKEEDYILLPEDIYTPTGKLYQKKGTKVTAYLEEYQAVDLCFVDGTNIKELENQINFFDKETNKKCVYLVSNINILDVYKKWPDRNRDMFPSKKAFESRFNVECIPTRIKLVYNDRIKNEYSIEKFKHSLEEMK